MTDKEYHEMTDDELSQSMLLWGGHVDTATGFPSAYFAASQCRAIEKVAQRRGVSVINNWPIRYG